MSSKTIKIVNKIRSKIKSDPWRKFAVINNNIPHHKFSIEKRNPDASASNNPLDFVLFF